MSNQEADLSALGLTQEDLGDTAVYVWPDVLPAVNVMTAMHTQWDSAGYGVTGLQYDRLPFVFRMAGVPRADWPDVFEDVRVMEAEALKHMNKDR